ncbi:glycoside hydrolase family protein [Comamonas suwonensis]|uniref:glycoside hydrolase family protein n=1 Tax=Comamonas suwonensis TaxID=2606214 RepID=UPI00145EDE7D|nr:endolysin [Comamonas suwonensis]MBI1625158.1 endolysin [Comamonas suwonensis]
MSSKIPRFLAGRLAALVLTLGAGGGAYLAADQAAIEQGLADQYVQAVAADPDTRQGVKVAMVLGHFYESSGKHIGTPYIDKLGKGAPLTVCNGITGAGVIAGKWYSPGECYQLEKGRYLQSERAAQRLLAYWPSYDAFVQGTFIDFLHNKGEANFSTSTMRRKANAGDLVGACLENPRWNKGTVKGVSTVLPGLQGRGDSNDEICRVWRMGTP